MYNIAADFSFHERGAFDLCAGETVLNIVASESVAIVEQMGLCEYVIFHTILPSSPVILWIELSDKPKWLPLNFGYHDVMRTGPIECTKAKQPPMLSNMCTYP